MNVANSHTANSKLLETVRWIIDQTNVSHAAIRTLLVEPMKADAESESPCVADALIQRVEGYLRDRNWTPSEANDLLMLCLAALRNTERNGE